jgi:hypothetical protein
MCPNGQGIDLPGGYRELGHSVGIVMAGVEPSECLFLRRWCKVNYEDMDLCAHRTPVGFRAALGWQFEFDNAKHRHSASDRRCLEGGALRAGYASPRRRKRNEDFTYCCVQNGDHFQKLHIPC